LTREKNLYKIVYKCVSRGENSMGMNNYINVKAIIVFICLCIILLISVSAMAQYTWSRKYGLPNSFSNAYALQSISDGGFIVAANMDSCSYGDKNVVVTRYNNSGGIMWQEVLDFDYDDAIHSIAIASDGGFVLEAGK
jgi:hypothetical protein